MVPNQNEVETSRLTAKQTIEKIDRLMPLSLKDKEEQFAYTYARHKGNTYSKLQYLYDFMEDIYGFVGNYVPCKKGCIHCCHIPVSISELEAKFITKHTSMKRSKANSFVNLDKSPCPFLKKGACSIYKVRPFVCRRHVMLDNTAKWCHIDVCDKITLTQLTFTEIDKFYEFLLHDSGKNERLDIREAFDSYR